ncbi:MAG: S46 family peptidase [Bacteroidales bacterium]|nr:S46 family peptidase [Bacteroidales bacterium]
MKKLVITALLALVCAMPKMYADEGMWLLSLVGKSYADMQKAGFKLSPEDVYSVNKSCLKDAIVGLGNDGSPFWHFCTGEIISDQGLISTNHHCGYGKLQEHSTVQHDYLRDGFWAYTKEEELPNPGLTASILVRMEDVTNSILTALSDDMSEGDRAKTVARLSKELAEKAKGENPGCEATVKAMFNGNQYFLFVHKIYKDVRLVGAPPSSMGKFGGDTDNWSWPRHTCDFSLFRIYTAPDGTPAPYSKNNVPLKPKHHLPVSIRDLSEGDYAMVMGFPGTTNRFLTSYGLEETMDVTNKLRYEIRTVKINILREEMAASQKTRIQYASKYASCSNYWKYSNEQNKALKQLNTMKVKRQTEQEYSKWAQGQLPKYQQALQLISDGYKDRRPYRAAMMYLEEGLLSGPEILWEAVETGYGLQQILDMEDRYQCDEALNQVRQAAAEFYKDYNQATEMKVFAAMTKYVYTNMEQRYCPSFIKQADKKYKGDFGKYTEELFKKSIFANQEAFNKFLDKPSRKALDKDPIFVAAMETYSRYREIYAQIPKESAEGLTRGTRDFVDGLLQINNGKKLLCPDANSTIRFTYGNVKAYSPKDAVTYSHYTTLDGVIQKEGPKGGEFEVPARLKELYYAQDFGQYANGKNQLPTCFLTTNDITGGNSGSPVIDAHGNLIGLAFDGNSEAMSGDIDFEENLQRCICLDSRYMLWVIDKYAGAKNLIDEIDIVK